MHCNFTYGERSSEEYGIIAVGFGNSSSNDLFSGQATKLVTDKSAQSVEWDLISQDYESPMEFILQVINEDGSDFSQAQERSLCQWLCKRGVRLWLFIQDERYSDIWIRCNINNPQIWIVGTVKGMQFTVTTSSAIAFSGEREFNYELTATDKTIDDLYVYNDEDIYVYPYMEITMMESGNLTITNSRETDPTYKTIINNLAVGEVVTMENGDIESNVDTHNILSDFNLMWPRLYDKNNVLAFSLKCNVTIKFREYRKLVVY